MVEFSIWEKIRKRGDERKWERKRREREKWRNWIREFAINMIPCLLLVIAEEREREILERERDFR